MRNSLLLCLIITLTLISHFKVLSLPTIEIQIEDPNNQKFISLLDKNKINTIYEDLSDNNDINIVTYPPEMVVTTLKVCFNSLFIDRLLLMILKPIHFLM